MYFQIQKKPNQFSNSNFELNETELKSLDSSVDFKPHLNSSWTSFVFDRFGTVFFLSFVSSFKLRIQLHSLDHLFLPLCKIHFLFLEIPFCFFFFVVFVCFYEFPFFAHLSLLFRILFHFYFIFNLNFLRTGVNLTQLFKWFLLIKFNPSI